MANNIGSVEVSDELRRVLPQIPDFEPYSPGLNIDQIRERFGLHDVIKLASNENPLGVSPVVQKAIERFAPMAFRYAQAGTPRLSKAIAAHLGVDPAQVVAGNGSDEIIDLLVRIKARPGIDNIIAFRPCFSMYEVQSRLCGVEFRQADLNPDFSFPFDALLALADEHTAICFVTTPDNPSGFAPPVAALADLARALRDRTGGGCLLVVDEAYMDFAEPQAAYSLLARLDEFPNLVILRTFSKMYGLAGLRLGYGIMPLWLADYMLRVKLPFSVNILAEEAGLAALGDEPFIQATMDAVRSGRKELAQGLAALGCDVRPSQANFLLFDLPRSAKMDAHGFFEALLERGIIIRPLAGYGLPSSLRVTVGDKAENRAFLKAARESLDA